VVMG